MSMLRKQFNELPIDKLKALVIANITFIQEVAPFSETNQTTSKLLAQVKSIDSKEALKSSLVNLMSLVNYWDKHQDNNGYFKPVEKNIVLDNLKKTEEVLKDVSKTPGKKY